MKPPPLAYHRPATEEESIELLRQYGDEAKLLAGGQSLVPLLNFRLSRPERLIDIARIPSLSFIRAQDQRLLLGAATRQATVERSPLISSRWPLLCMALAHVGHPQTRSRGTIGGSVAHADPASELPVVLAALDAQLHLRSARGIRILDWYDFFETEFVTACAPDEMLTAVEIPPLPARTGMSFREYAVRYGDFAVAGAASVISLDERGRCAHASLALLACGPAAVRAGEAEQGLIGEVPTPEVAARAAASAVTAADFPSGQDAVPLEYRRQVLRALLEDAILDAAQNAARAMTEPQPA